MNKEKARNTKLIVCSVKSELQAAQVTKICQDYGIQAVIKLKPAADVSELKKALKAKLKDRIYEPCPCGTGKKFKFCCYENTINIQLYE